MKRRTFQSRMKTALFLGAGASKFVDHPTTEELLEEVQKQIGKLDVEEHIQRYILEILDYSSFHDVEELYDCIDRMVDMQNNERCNVVMSRMRHDSYDIRYSDIVDALTELRSSIRDMLFDSFKLDLKNISKIKKVYDGIWSVMKGSGSDEFQIVTTNYDQVLERYCDKAKWTLVNGFVPAPNGTHRDWVGNWDTNANKPLYLTKLHGSITWQKESDGAFIEQKTPGRGDDDTDVIRLPVLGPKKYDEAPFDKLLDNFKEIISNIDVLVVAGFSFRDPEINEIIRDQLNKGLFLVAISPTAATDVCSISTAISQVNEKRLDNLPFARFGSHVLIYDEKFNADTISTICSTLKLMHNEYGATIVKLRKAGLQHPSSDY